MQRYGSTDTAACATYIKMAAPYVHICLRSNTQSTRIARNPALQLLSVKRYISRQLAATVFVAESTKYFVKKSHILRPPVM